MSSISVPRSLGDASTFDDSPPGADSVEREREIEGKLRPGLVGTVAEARGAPGLGTVAVLMIGLPFPLATRVGRCAAARTVGSFGFAGFADFRP